jgi:hypothetical protein
MGRASFPFGLELRERLPRPWRPAPPSPEQHARELHDCGGSKRSAYPPKDVSTHASAKEATQSGVDHSGAEDVSAWRRYTKTSRII